MQKIYTKGFCFIAVFFSLLLAGCRKSDSTADYASPPDLVTKINSSVSGFVTDEHDAPVTGAQVKMGTATVFTDRYGYFEMNNISVVKDAAVVTVSRSGYFKAIKTYMAKEGKKAFFRIKLIPKTTAGTFTTGTGGTVTLPGGLSISLPANAVVNETTNVPYSGTVTIAASWLDPAGKDLSNLMPGDLRGINTDGNAQLLTTYGMAAVQLTGSGGEVLQVAPGKTATLSFPIPSGMAGSAPAFIPLWYFDEGTGLWKEEGSAVKTGSNYTGAVSHFSFWNVDVPANFVQFDCTVVTANGQPVPGVWVKIHVQSNPANSASGYTNTSGYVNGAVPANAQLVLEIFSNTNCATPSYTQTFSTGTTNISLGNIVISTATTVAAVSGRVVDCSNNPVSDGYIMLRKDNSFTRTAVSSTGTYSLAVLLCNSTTTTISLIGEDAANGQQSTAADYTINPGNNNIPDIQACGINISEFFDYSIGGTSYHLTLPGDSTVVVPTFNGISFIVTSKKPISNIASANFYMDRAGIAPGTVQPVTSFYSNQVPLGSMLVNTSGVTITEYGSIGQFMSGSFTGTFLVNTPTPSLALLTCSFRVRRSI